MPQPNLLKLRALNARRRKLKHATLLLYTLPGFSEAYMAAGGFVSVMQDGGGGAAGRHGKRKAVELPEPRDAGV